jgi:Kef-type K+ transport system membrane component KefB
VAILGKLAAGLGAFGMPGVNRYAIGVGMIPRGEVGLVFAAVGTASGILSDALDVSIIVMVIVTTFVAPLWLRSAFGQPSAVVAAAGEPDSAALVDLPPTDQAGRASFASSPSVAPGLIEAEEPHT